MNPNLFARTGCRRMIAALRRLLHRVPRVVPRDESGRFLSPHKLAVHAKCREMCAAMGRDVPKELTR
jgi:hypothetical protein